MKAKLVLVLLLAFGAFVGPMVLRSSVAHADGIEVRSQAAQTKFPDGVTFTIFLASNAEINSVRFNYRILPDGTNVAGRPQCTTGAVVNCNIAVGGSSAAFMVPGADILYSWEIADAAGNKLETDQARYTYTDTRFQWQTITSGILTVNYYSGSENTNRTILDTARQIIDKMSALEGTKIDFPVKIWVYATANDMRPAILSNRRIKPNANDPTTLGEVVYSDTAMVSRDTMPLDIVRHEVTHIVTRQALKGALGDSPAWLDEGTSVYAQNQLLPDELQALDLAIKRNKTLSIFSLTSSTLTQTDTSLFYAQSWSTIKYLIESQGPEKFAPFIAALRRDTTDGALKQVYGFDQAGLEDGWRKSVGLPPIERPAGGGTSSSERALPTIVPFGAGGSQGAPATPGANQEDGQTSTAKGGSETSLALIAAVIVAIFAIGGGAGLYLVRARSKG